MTQFAGRADVYLNGQLLDTYDGVKLETGGWERSPASTSRNTGFTKKRKDAHLTLERGLAKGNSIKDTDVEGATITVKWDTGQTHTINNAYRGPTPTLGDDGKETGLEFYGDPAEEIV